MVGVQKTIGLAKVGHEAHQAAPRLLICKRAAKDITAMGRGAGNPRASSGAAHFDALAFAIGAFARVIAGMECEGRAMQGLEGWDSEQHLGEAS
eukprot:CAMPEP_0179452032 /NCGR_PEP_ID=MMETSP0799-20121207/36001_1 /TAXON_ID=46947 /ORGANISM="Geminigera cryophila, Strain CCMP2564" /LENGTH=93 /DNA_ID=CAMNT_0021247715 /DNA_START=218 /DNA_END=497 /DNA_ORIENTATION=+